jgi:septal ring factor EnvC (AmiA/AmiB activator)
VTDKPAHALAALIKRDPSRQLCDVEIAAAFEELCKDVHHSEVSESSPVQFAIKKLIHAVVEVHRQLDIAETEKSIRRSKDSIRSSQATLKSQEKRLAELSEAGTDGR